MRPGSKASVTTRKRLTTRAAASAKSPRAKKEPTSRKEPVDPKRGATAKALRAVLARPRAAKRAEAPAATAPGRRAVFIDVENTSSEERLFEVLEALQIDRAERSTQISAVGNWRAISQRLGRRLGAVGAQLVHSAPAPGVRDWSDLWIAVAAGCWLGRAAPGDVLEIISNDRAFDAVGDAAAAVGVTFRRLLLRRGAAEAASEVHAEPARARRSRGGRRRRGRGASTSAATPSVPLRQPPGSQPALPVGAVAEPHGASATEMMAVIDQLTGADTGRWINLDVLEKALKTRGFSRPPGSPRLVTRLRALKDVEVDSHGRVRLLPAPIPAPGDAAVAEARAPRAGTAARRRRRRRSSASGTGADAPPSEMASAVAAPPHGEPATN
jgi:hypothetical protein